MRFFNARRLGLLLALKSVGPIDETAVASMIEHPHLTRIFASEGEGEGWQARAILWDFHGVTSISEAGQGFLLRLQQACLRRGLRLLVVTEDRKMRSDLRSEVGEWLEFFAGKREALRAIGLEGPRPIGRLLLEMGKIGRKSLELALARQKTRPTWTRLGKILVEAGLVSLEDVRAALCLQRQARCLLA